MFRFWFVITLIFCGVKAGAQVFVPLWPEGKKPNFNGTVVKDSLFNERIWQVGNPGFFVFPVSAAENKGTAVLICPGGGYERLSHLYNGFNFAHWFNAQGITVFVLLYRLPHQKDLVVREEAPRQDAQRALKIIRARSAGWGIDPGRIGIMGVSAGGHVASSTGITESDYSKIGDDLDSVHFRPDFMILLSPVETMGRYAHPGSKRNFLGKDTSASFISRYSNEFNVSSSTPPTFIVHAQNDSTVDVRNSLIFYNALIEKKVSASIHVFPQGAHGIKLVDNPGSTQLWLPLLSLWMEEKGFVKPVKK